MLQKSLEVVILKILVLVDLMTVVVAMVTANEINT